MRLLSLLLLFNTSVAFGQETAPFSGIELDIQAGSELGLVFQSWLSPHQEGGEERETPYLVPSVFKSTAPSVDRADRPSRGHGTLAFTRDFNRAVVDIAIQGVDPKEIVMFHIHCGRPGHLGPILVDFSLEGDLNEMLADGKLTVEITNSDISAAAEEGSGLVAAFTAGCPISPANPLDKVKTVAGMAHIARMGELYFNLHTNGQTFFGDIRGQLYPVE